MARLKHVRSVIFSPANPFEHEKANPARRIKNKTPFQNLISPPPRVYNHRKGKLVASA
jgi:hypothetical protein